MNSQATLQDFTRAAADRLLEAVSAFPPCRTVQIRTMMMSAPMSDDIMNNSDTADFQRYCAAGFYDEHYVQTYRLGIAQGRIMWLVQSTALVSTDLAEAQAALMAESAKMRPILTRLGWRRRFHA